MGDAPITKSRVRNASIVLATIIGGLLLLHGVVLIAITLGAAAYRADPNAPDYKATSVATTPNHRSVTFD